MAGIQQALFVKGAGTGAPVDSSIKFLMSFDGNFSEANGQPVTLANSPTINTSITKFGSGSMRITNGIGTNYGRASVSTMPTRSNVDPFTLECWFYKTAGRGEEIRLVQTHGNASIGFFFEVSPPNDYYLMRLGSNFIGYQAGPVTIPTNQWVHYRGVWTGGTGYLFVNGILIDSRALTGAAGSDNSAFAGPPNNIGDTNAYTIYIDEAMISNDAKSTTNFTPPTQAYPRL